jgi:CheY-like chemotaxis protein
MPLCLIVEDHGDTREGYAEYLAGCGLDVRMAASAAEFWAVLEQAVPDVILMDLRLPEVDGWTLTRQARQDPRTARVPIVVVSGSVREEDRLQALDSGADVFLAKPCDLDEIVSHIQRLLRRPAL